MSDDRETQPDPAARLPAQPVPATSLEARTAIVEMLRRDLIGPLPEDVAPSDADLQRERLGPAPSSWYLTGFISPVGQDYVEDDPDQQEETETTLDGLESDTPEAEAAAADDELPEPPTVRRRFTPSSIGLTVLVPAETQSVKVRVTWGDYLTEPPLPVSILIAEETDGGTVPNIEWQRVPREQPVTLAVPANGKGAPVPVPDSAAHQRPGGALELTCHARPFTIEDPDAGPIHVKALSIFLVNRRDGVRRRYADIAAAFQVRLAVTCAEGLLPRHDLTGYRSDDDDHRIADLHYRKEAEYAVGRNISAGWEAPDESGVVRCAWTNPLPTAEVEQVAPNLDIQGVEFGMEALAGLAAEGGDALTAQLSALPDAYGQWIAGQTDRLDGLAARRRDIGERLIADAETARQRIAAGIELLQQDNQCRRAFRIMNLAISRAIRRRSVGAAGDPETQPAPRWRPFQLAYILLNLSGLTDKTSPDREIVDLLFFPTGGGKTEAYLGLAAYTIARRRLSAGGVLGAGVAVIMRYTLRLLTLDQLSRAAGVVCALELMRTDPEFVDEAGQPILGDWPIEIGLWVGSDASPNILGGTRNTGDHTAVTRVRRFKKDGRQAPAPIKSCPWCGTAFDKQSFDCCPDFSAPKNMTITCANPNCDFTRDRPLPLLTVDETIYRRLPAFIIATVDKFAGLPWLGQAGAFFGHVTRHDEHGFYGAAEPNEGRPLYNDSSLDPPELIIQDELHLISGPLGTVAGLYETAIDRLASRHYEGHRVRPKIVASTATVRRARDQIRALFDRKCTRVFPPPGIERTDSFFAHTLPSSDQHPARLYLGLAAQGRGPKLVFLRGLTTLMASAGTIFHDAGGIEAENNPADPYMTALSYFNALRELGGARRIVEDEVHDRLSRYSSHKRIEPPCQAFEDRTIGDPLELTSRVSTDEVAEAKSRLESAFCDPDAAKVDVALATNMISVGLDISRLGLMVVQGQPKTAAEYIQASSRVGRQSDKPGLVVTILNLHKPRDRTHYESFHLFHRTFYRAVEATSVTPWAARALDRSLAAVLVTIGRHLRPEMTPERAVQAIGEIPDYREEVINTFLERAPDGAIVGGREALRTYLEKLLDDWETVVDALAPRLVYSDRRQAAQPLLHQPLDPAIANLNPPEHRRFLAARSMRDVEANIVLRVRDPYGNSFNADDI
jgi:hypothetical protein